MHYTKWNAIWVGCAVAVLSTCLAAIPADAQGLSLEIRSTANPEKVFSGELRAAKDHTNGTLQGKGEGDLSIDDFTRRGARDAGYVRLMEGRVWWILLYSDGTVADVSRRDAHAPALQGFPRFRAAGLPQGKYSVIAVRGPISTVDYPGGHAAMTADSQGYHWCRMNDIADDIQRRLGGATKTPRLNDVYVAAWGRRVVLQGPVLLRISNVIVPAIDVHANYEVVVH